MGDNYKYDSQGWEAYKKSRAKSTTRQEVCSKNCRNILTNKQRKEKKENRISGVERLVKKNAFLQQIPLER